MTTITATAPPIPRLFFIRHVVTGRLAEGLDRRALSWPSLEQARAYLDAQRPERPDPGAATWADEHEVAGVIVGDEKGEAKCG